MKGKGQGGESVARTMSFSRIGIKVVLTLVESESYGYEHQHVTRPLTNALSPMNPCIPVSECLSMQMQESISKP